jgi:flagellin
MTAADTITINNVQFSGTDLNTPATTSGGGTFADIVTKINGDAVAAGSDVRAELTGGSTTSGNIRLYSASGANISVASATGEIRSVLRSDGDNTASDDAAVTSITSTAETFTGSLTFSSESGPIVFGVADGSTTVLQDDAETLATVFGVTMTGTGSSTSGASVSGLNVSSATNASASLATVDAAIDAVASMRGDLGALQNRLSHTISNLQTTSENHEASRSLVEDADYATESAALAKSQVLAQASSAMLAQANAAPQLALQLIQ